MSAGFRCDGPGCREFGPQHAPWWFLAQQGTAPSGFMETLMGHPQAPLTFCSAKCVADWAYELVIAASPATGTERPPLGGLGWPR